MARIIIKLLVYNYRCIQDRFINFQRVAADFTHDAMLLLPTGKSECQQYNQIKLFIVHRTVDTYGVSILELFHVRILCLW